MGEAVEHIPESVPPSFSPLSFLLRLLLLLLLLYVVRGLHSAKAAAASPSARQGLVFRGQTAKFSDGYIVQLDSLLLRTSPTARRPLPQPPPPTHTRSPLFLAHASLTPCVMREPVARVRVGCNPGDSCDAHARKTVSARKCLNGI